MIVLFDRLPEEKTAISVAEAFMKLHRCEFRLEYVPEGGRWYYTIWVPIECVQVAAMKGDQCAILALTRL